LEGPSILYQLITYTDATVESFMVTVNRLGEGLKLLLWFWTIETSWRGARE
jgi:hypothetical protein